MTIIQAGRLTVSEQADRNRTALILAGDGTALGIVEGVQSGLVLTKTSGMGWQLDIGRCVIAPATAANGPVVAAVTVAETGSFAAGDATRDRIDVVSLQIDETATIANGLPAVKTVVIQGAYPGAGQPVTPTVPAGAIGLWSVRINAGTSAGGGGWNTSLLVDLRGLLLGQLPHAELTSSQVVANNTATGCGVLTLDTANSTDSTFVTPGTNNFTVVQAGTYAIHAKSALTPAAGGRSFVSIEAGGLTIDRRNIYPGEDQGGAGIGNLKLAAGSVVTVSLFQGSGGNITFANRLRVTKIG